MKKHEHHLTVGDLLKFIEKHNLPMDAPVMMQRVEDHYYEPGKGWEENSVKMKGFHYHSHERLNNDMRAEMYRMHTGADRHYEMEDPATYITTQEELDSMKEQYTQAWSPVFYKEEPNALFLDAHY
jgi:hypothetical protein